MPSYHKIHQWVPMTSVLQPHESESKGFIRDSVDRSPAFCFLNGLSVQTLLRDKPRPITGKVVDKLVSDRLLSWLPRDLRTIALRDLMTHMHQTGPGSYAVGSVKYPIFISRQLNCKYTEWQSWRVNDTKDGIEVISCVTVYSLNDPDGVKLLALPDDKPLLTGMVKATLKFDVKDQKWHQTGLDAVMHCHDREIEKALETYTDPDSHKRISSFSHLKTKGAKALARELLHLENMSALQALSDPDEIDELYKAIFDEVENYRIYLEETYAEAYEKDRLQPDNPPLYLQKHKCIREIIFSVSYRDMETKEKLIKIFSALYDHRGLLSKNEDAKERSIWRRIERLQTRGEHTELIETKLEALSDPDEIDELYKAIFDEVENYRIYLEETYAEAYEKDRLQPDNRPLYLQKHKCIREIISSVSYRDMETKEKLIKIVSALYEHRALLSKNEDAKEKAIWRRIERLQTLGEHTELIETKVYKQVFAEVQNYQTYLRKKYKLQAKEEPISEERSLAQGKYNRISKILSDVASTPMTEINSKEKLLTLAKSLYEHRALLSKHQDFNERSIWGRIKRLLIQWGLWKSQGEKVLGRVEKAIDSVVHTAGEKHRWFSKPQPKAEERRQESGQEPEPEEQKLEPEPKKPGRPEGDKSERYEGLTPPSTPRSGGTRT